MWLSYEHWQLLFLVLVANGIPLMGAGILRSAFRYPVDQGLVLHDGHPLLGTSKTWRGIGLAVLITPVISHVLGTGWLVGVVVAVFAMLGDLFSSFVKRRLGMPSSSMALGLDQVPEALFPVLACHFLIAMTWVQTVVLVGLFFILELVLSRILYWLHLRRQPY